MWWDSINNGISATANAVSAGYGIFASEKNAQFQKNVHEQNLQFQKDKLDYDKNLQQQIFAREDNAVQRRVADLKAAGINPVFAAGSSAGAGSVVQTTAPHGDGAGMNAATVNRLHAGQMIMNALKMKAEIDHTRADARRIAEEARWIRERREGEVEGIGLDNESKRINNRIRLLDERLRDNDVSMIEVRNEKERIQNYLEREFKEQRWSENELELVSKALAITARRFQLNEDQRDAVIRRVMFLTQQGQSFYSLIQQGGTFINEVLNSIPFLRNQNRVTDTPVYLENESIPRRAR